MDIELLINRPRFRDRNKANITTAGYLYLNSRLADSLGIDESKRYKLGLVYKQGIPYPAILEDSNGNKISKQHKGYVLYMKNLKEKFKMADNQKMTLEKITNRKIKGYLLINSDNREWITYN